MNNFFAACTFRFQSESGLGARLCSCVNVYTYIHDRVCTLVYAMRTHMHAHTVQHWSSKVGDVLQTMLSAGDQVVADCNG